MAKYKTLATHEQIRCAFSDIYNGFYCKYRLKEKAVRTDEEWAAIIDDAQKLINDYPVEFLKDMIEGIIEVWEEQEKLTKLSMDFEL